MTKWWILVLVAIAALSVSIVACGDDDDDDDDDDAADDDADDDDDDSADDDTGADDDMDDDADDDDMDDDDADDDDADDDTDEGTPISQYALLLENAKVNIATGGIDFDRAFISTSGTMTIDQIGTTTGATFEGSLQTVGFTQAEVDFDAGTIGILQDGDTGVLALEEVTATITAVPVKKSFDVSGTPSGAKAEAFNMSEFTQCASPTCVSAAYASVTGVYQVSEYTDGILATNDWMLIWAIPGDATNGSVYDLTIELDE
ncbi:hypothetical protein K8I61_18920 [bacterium]|nr:hypothetical protein [bacterium]